MDRARLQKMIRRFLFSGKSYLFHIPAVFFLYHSFKDRLTRPKVLKTVEICSSNSQQKIRLLPSEQLLKNTFIHAVYLYQNEIDFQRFAKALEKSLETYYVLGSRVVDGSLECGNPVELVLCQDQNGSKTKDLFDMDSKDLNRKFLQNRGGHSSGPSLYVQITKLEDGVALGFAQSHACGDCRTLLQFVVDLAKAYRGEKIESKPNFERDVKSWVNPNKAQVSSKLREIPGLVEMTAQKLRSAQLFAFFYRHRIRLEFTREWINQAKQHAKDATAYEVICAHLWTHLWRLYGKTEDEGLSGSVCVSLNGRGVDQNSFGNAITYCALDRYPVESVTFSSALECLHQLRDRMPTLVDQFFTEQNGYLHNFNVSPLNPEKRLSHRKLYANNMHNFGMYDAVFDSPPVLVIPHQFSEDILVTDSPNQGNLHVYVQNLSLWTKLKLQTETYLTLLKSIPND